MTTDVKAPQARGLTNFHKVTIGTGVVFLLLMAGRKFWQWNDSQRVVDLIWAVIWVAVAVAMAIYLRRFVRSGGV